jgi:proteasome lid subunit RPN8/RPN11
VPDLRRPRLWLSEQAAADIRAAAAAAHPVETGGVLLGVYVGRRRPWVVRAVVVPSMRAGHTSYELPPGARPTAVDAARRIDNRLGYLGDWHAHPRDADPSSTDVATMCDLAEDHDARCPHPVLLIARRTPAGYRLDARQLARRKLRKLRVIAAGGLPRAHRKRRSKR